MLVQIWYHSFVFCNQLHVKPFKRDSSTSSTVVQSFYTALLTLSMKVLSKTKLQCSNSTWDPTDFGKSCPWTLTKQLAKFPQGFCVRQRWMHELNFLRTAASPHGNSLLWNGLVEWWKECRYLGEIARQSLKKSWDHDHFTFLGFPGRVQV